jgi:hypothetical protein
MLQRVITPAMTDGYLTHGLDQVRGYVLAEADVAGAQTPAQLFSVHGLGFPGSPFDPAQHSIDVLLFPATPFTHLVPAVGRTTTDDRSAGDDRALPGAFVDHPPFTGTGFAPSGEATDDRPSAPLWWVHAARLPAGSEIWRVGHDASRTLLGVFENVAQGWVTAPSLPAVDPADSASASASVAAASVAAASVAAASVAATDVPASDVLGVFGTWTGARCLVDLVGDGYAVVASYVDIPGAGLELGPRGLFWRQVPAGQVQDVHEIRVTCSWRGAPFLLTSREQQSGGELAHLMYLGRDAAAAEALQLTKTDAGVYEATVPMDQLSGIQAKQFVQA